MSDVTRDIDALHAFGRVVGARWSDARDATFGEPVGSESDNMAEMIRLAKMRTVQMKKCLTSKRASSVRSAPLFLSDSTGASPFVATRSTATVVLTSALTRGFLCP